MQFLLSWNVGPIQISFALGVSLYYLNLPATRLVESPKQYKSKYFSRAYTGKAYSQLSVFTVAGAVRP